MTVEKQVTAPSEIGEGNNSSGERITRAVMDQLNSNQKEYPRGSFEAALGALIGGLLVFSTDPRFEGIDLDHVGQKGKELILSKTQGLNPEQVGDINRVIGAGMGRLGDSMLEAVKRIESEEN